MGVDISRFGNQALVPTVYRANYRDPSVFFATQRFPMRNHDVIYVTNSDSVELDKFLAHMENITGAFSTVTGDVLATKLNVKAIGQ